MRLYIVAAILLSVNYALAVNDSYDSYLEKESADIVAAADTVAAHNYDQEADNFLTNIREAREKGSNRLFVSAGGVGLYMRDLPELASMGISLAADAFLYSSIKRARIAHIIEAIEQDLDGFHDALMKSWQQQFALEHEYNKRSWISRFFTNKAARILETHKPLVDYANEHHSYMHRNPIKRDLIMPIALYMICDRAYSALVEATKCTSSLPRALQPAYRIDSNGNYVQTHHMPFLLGMPLNGLMRIGSLITGNQVSIPFETTPICVSSVANMALFTMCPWRIFRACGNNGNMLISVLRGINLLTENKIPQLFLSPVAGFAYECLGVIFATQFFNAMHHDLWVREIIAQRTRLSKLIQAMINARDTGAQEEVYLQARGNLVQFVEEIHLDKAWQPGEFLRRWVSSLGSGAFRVYKWPLYTLIGIAGYKIGKFCYQAMK